MTVILNFPEADALCAVLRRGGIYSAVREDIPSELIQKVDTVILTERHVGAIPKLKNEKEELFIIYIGEKQGNALFCDCCVKSASEVPAVFQSGDRLISCGGVIIDVLRSVAEYKGSEIGLSTGEINIIRCIATSKDFLSAALVSELALGREDPGLAMTHISKINKKISKITGRPLVISEHHKGYRINS